ncbi:alcohol dehydrogenase catalytic domain-containing protein [Candidatus Methanomassiliicoccus intestinalis]|mgnify:CR=1 FL=1|uniref:alcohol dehydrogenase catalytic domain-containing protein n=1 Tax=Candidatus Methanomassiliicoccus intestinalis TaxID=1406512 RepID=UPI0037DC2949
MKAALLSSPQELTITEVAKPTCPDGGLLLKVEACAICPTDLKMWRRGQRDLVYPRILGHEVAGTVVEDRSGKYAVGDRVQVWPGVACGTCAACAKGMDNMCAEQGIIGFNYDGGFAEYMAVPAGNVLRSGVNLIPEHVSFEEAALTEPLACCVHALERCALTAGETILIFGAGTMGQLATAAAMGKGCQTIVVEPSAERKNLPATAVFSPDHHLYEKVMEVTAGRGADVVLLTTPQAAIDNNLLNMTAQGGRICIFSGLNVKSPERIIDMNTIHYHELSLVGAYGCTSSSNTHALAMIADGLIDVRRFIQKRVSLEQLQSGLEAIENGEVLKCMVTKF